MRAFVIVLLMMCSFDPGRSQDDMARDQRMQWWREARFGMFIVWGVYAVPAGIHEGQKIDRIGEWIMNRGKIPVIRYKEYAKQFNPVKYDPERWVRMAKDAGMKYVVITAKHHDGFALFGSRASSWNMVDATPYGRDLLKPLSEACKEHGIRLGFYYSQAQDWCNPGGAVARRVTTEGWPNPDSARIDAYTAEHGGHWDPAQTTKTMSQYIDDVAVPQVRELLTHYGEVAVLWWDTPTDMTDEYAWKFEALLNLQPGVITNDRLKSPNFAGHFTTPEQRIPNLSDLDGKDWETCMTMNETWGYKSYDENWKSPETLIRNLIDIASKGGNFLLNIGPKADGEVPEESVRILQEMGRWMKVNGEAIHATRASPLSPLSWGRCTRKESPEGTILYFSVFDWPSNGALMVPGMKNRVTSVTLLATGEPLKTSPSDDGVAIHVPLQSPDRIASVIRMEVEGKLVGRHGGH